MTALSLERIKVTALKRVQTPGGDVLHALKASDPDFVRFGEVYFSWIEPGAIKAWKCHQRMTLNLVVPLGAVRFVFHLPDQGGRFRCEEIGESRYARLTVPPGIWFGFRCCGSEKSLLMNLADIAHDPGEALRKSISEIEYNWE